MSQGEQAAIAQLEIWLAEQRDPDSPRWLIPVDIEFRPGADPAALRAALGDILRRHPQLRSGFEVHDGSLRRLESDAALPFRVQRHQGPYSRAEALRRAAELGGRPLAIDSPPLLRADLLAWDDGALLGLEVHHIVADGWSVDVLCRHLVAAYAARLADQEPELPGPAGDDLEPMEVTAAEREAAAAHWTQIAEGGYAALTPLPDFVTADPVPGPARHVAATLSDAALDAVRDFAGRELTSSAVVLLTAWCLLLHLHSGLDDGVVALPFSGRNDEATHEEIGLYTRLLPVRSQLDRTQAFVGMLRGMREQTISALEWSEHIDALDDRSIRRQAARVVFAYFLVQSASWRVGDTMIEVVRHPGETAKHALALACTEQPGQMELRIDFDSDVYREETARLLLDQLLRLLASAVTRPDATCHAIACTLAAEPPPSRQATSEPAAWLPGLILEQAAARPDAAAVTDGAITLTYRELATRAGTLASWLAGRGVGPGDVVALLLPPGADTIVATLGVAMAGAAYLPLDPAEPDARLAVILADAAPRLLLTGSQARDRAAISGLAVWTVSEALASKPEPDHPIPHLAAHQQQVFNVLYTSGSTGRPKGVQLHHGGLARLMHQPSFLPLGPDDVVSQLSPLNFDAASYEIWSALAHGARLVILPKELVLSPRELRVAIRREGVTTLVVTTPLLNRIIDDAPDILQTVRRVYFGGELISVPHLRRGVAWAGPGTLLHSYGPTENSFTSTWWSVDEVDARSRTLPVGTPVPGTAAYVVFEGTYDLAPPGVPGELLLGGAGVAHGYLGNPRETAKSFVPDPFGPRPGGRLYKTGDRVRWTPDGQLEFVGRNDNQIKIRSQRVELGEVEAALRACAGVESAFVTARADRQGMKQIIAYLTLGGQVTTGAVKAHLRQVLPSFAIPAHLVAMDELPLNANGKIDRSRLPEPVTAVGMQTSGRPPSTGQHLRADGTSSVRGAWREVLGHDAFGEDDNFFDVGGHSLLLVALQDALRRHVGRAPAIAELLRSTTVRGHAGLLGNLALADLTRPDDQTRSADHKRSAGPALRQDDQIAIIGMACRLGAAEDLWGFWARLASGRDAMTQAAEPLVTELADGTRRIARYGALPDTAFDGDLFGLVAGTTDPHYGLMYECLWAAAENAALQMTDLAGRTSVYLGCSRARRPPVDGDIPVRADDVVGTDPTFLPTRFSYWYDLMGESILIDTACSTSLVAVHLACQSLLSGRSDYAFAGGVSVQAEVNSSYLYVPGQIYSADGYCRPHDRRASGTVPGEGAGAVLLRRLSDALRDGDPVWAVIMGSAVNNDGIVKLGYSAPGVEGQASVISDALAAAGLNGSDVDYVEAHGTGTRMGDTIETIALTEALGPDGPPVAVGSVKATIGHTDAAAGVAGLIKTALAIHHSYLPATPGVGEPIEELTRFGARFGQVPGGMPWPNRGRPRTAGVSSFGVGGTNAHILIREPPQPTTPMATMGEGDPVPRIAALAARSADGLAEQSERLATYLAAHTELSLADVATTLAVGRAPFPVRRAVVAEDRQSLVAALAGEPERAPGTFVAQGVAPTGGARCLIVLADPAADGAPNPADPVPAVRDRLGQARSFGRDEPVPASVGQLSWLVGVVEQLRAWQVDIAEIRGHGLGERARRVLTGIDDFADVARALAKGAAVHPSAAAAQAPQPASGPLVALVVGSADPVSWVASGEQAGATVVLDSRDGGVAALVRAVAELWCHGVRADLLTGQSGSRRYLPGQRFERGAAPDVRPSVETAPPVDTAPLTHLQQRLLFQDLVRLGSAAEHHVAVGCALTEVDLPLLRDCLRQLQCSDPRLRTYFRRIGDRWLSCVAAEPSVVLQVDADWARDAASRTDEAILGLALRQPLGLVDDVPLQATLVNRPNGRGLVVLAAYRGIIDQASLLAALQTAALSYGRALTARDGQPADGDQVLLLAPAGMTG